MTLRKLTVISNESSKELARKIAKSLKIEYTEVFKKTFGDGEMYHALPFDRIEDKTVIIVGSTENDSALQELLDLIAGCHYWNAGSIIVVIPYLGYSTMERAKIDLGEIPKGITRTRQIFRAHPDTVIFLDLHSESVIHVHESIIKTYHLQSYSLITEEIKKLKLKNYVLVSPDYGRSKWVSKLASDLKVPYTTADKDRFDFDKTLVKQVSEAVNGRDIIIVDDMIRTGGSIVETGQRCKEAGAKNIYVITPHLILAQDAVQKLKDGDIKKVLGSDSFPIKQKDKLVKYYSVGPFIAKFLKKILDIQ